MMPKTSGKNKSSTNDFARTAVIFSDLSVLVFIVIFEF